jgi:hypothetical protein
MNHSHLDKLAESYAQIAEGGKHEKSAMNWNKKDDNPEGKKVDKKKVDKCTCESFYLKRLHAMNPVYAEQYRAIAEVLIGEGYESSRLLDNIIEVLPMDVVGPEFVSAMKAVNPRIHENLETAEKKQARAIVLEQIRMKSWDEWKRGIKNVPGNLQRAGQSVLDFINPPASKSADPVVRQGGSYTGPSGTAVTSSSSTPSAEQKAEKLRQQRQETQDALRGTTRTTQTGEKSAAANDAKQQAAKQQAQVTRTSSTGGTTGASSGSTGSAYTPPAPKPDPNAAYKALQAKARSASAAGDYKAANAATREAETLGQTQFKAKFGANYGRRSGMTPNKLMNNMPGSTLKNSYEVDGEQIDEIAPALAAGAALGIGAAGLGLVKNLTKQKKAAESGKGSGGTLVDKLHQRKKALQGEELQLEGIRDKDPEKGTEERKERLEKKRGHKVDDHPEYKKDKKDDDSYLETDMKKRRENNEKARKEMAAQKDDTVPRWMKDDFNLYDVILTYLDENGLMDSVEHAEAIMEQLTAEQIESIVEDLLGEAFPPVKGTLNPWESPKTGKSGVKYVTGPDGKPKEIKNPLYKGV